MSMCDINLMPTVTVDVNLMVYGQLTSTVDIILMSVQSVFCPLGYYSMGI